MDVRSEDPMPRFPLSQPPRCRKCQQPCKREPRGRRYCYCCPCLGGSKQPVWSTWDDAEGVRPGNTLCDCGFYCRVDTKRSGESFEACALGRCYMSARNGRSRVTGPSAGAWNRTVAAPSSPQAAPSPHTPSHAHPSSSLGSPQRMRPSLFGSSSNASEPLEPPSLDIDDEFVRLLGHVMAAAERARFPSRVMDMSGLMAALPDVAATGSANPRPGPFRIQSSTDFDRHSKVGAAGELFVFSLLCSVLKGQVYRDDWRSNMRNLVKQHPRFREMPDWSGPETADIVFPDDDGGLTNLLIENGYLEYSEWRGQRPEYLIEVKSSLSNKNKEFYMSSNQYQRMQEHSASLPSSTSRAKIYMIARVSNLQDWDIDLRLFVDPDSLRKDGKLRFKQVWTVEYMDD